MMTTLKFFQSWPEIGFVISDKVVQVVLDLNISIRISLSCVCHGLLLCISDAAKKSQASELVHIKRLQNHDISIDCLSCLCSVMDHETCLIHDKKIWYGYMKAQTVCAPTWKSHQETQWAFHTLTAFKKFVFKALLVLLEKGITS